VRPVITGTGLLVSAADTVKLAAFELPPPGDGFVTMTTNVPVVVRSDAFNPRIS
jgi:hypothetical protein